MKKIILIVSSIFFLSGCGFKEVEPTPQSYRLENTLSQKVFETTDLRVILIQNIGGDSVALSKSIIYNQNGALKPYKYSRWSEFPAVRLQQLIVESFERRKLFKATIPTLSLAKSDLSLESELERFEQVYEKGDSFVQISMNFRLIQNKDTKILGTTSLHVKVPLRGEKTLDTIHAFNEAVGEMILQLGDWTKEQINEQ